MSERDYPLCGRDCPLCAAGTHWHSAQPSTSGAVWITPLREDTVTNTVDDAARWERERAEAAGEYDDTRPGWGDI